MNSTETELNNLELKINALIDRLNRLRVENQALRSQLAISARERSQLKIKNQDAAAKIYAIIKQLRESLS